MEYIVNDDFSLSGTTEHTRESVNIDISFLGQLVGYLLTVIFLFSVLLFSRLLRIFREFFFFSRLSRVSRSGRPPFRHEYYRTTLNLGRRDLYFALPAYRCCSCLFRTKGWKESKKERQTQYYLSFVASV